MQHRYAADVGDYLKLALLRQLGPSNRLGVVWWLFPDEDHNSDGRHIDYLDKPEWQKYDPELFSALRQVVDTGARSVEALEATGILTGATFFSEYVPIGALERDRCFRTRSVARRCDPSGRKLRPRFPRSRQRA